MASLYRYGTSEIQKTQSLEPLAPGEVNCQNGHSLPNWQLVGPNSILQTFDFSQLVFAVHFDFSVVVAVLLQLACFDSFVVAVVVLALPMDLVFAAGVLAFYLADLDPVTEAGFPFL